MKHPRELIAALVVLVGGTLWIVLPESPGSLRDESTAVRRHLPTGRGLAGWVLVRNKGVDAIELTSVRIGSGLDRDVELLGTVVRPGYFPTVEARWPSRRRAFVPADGYVVAPGRKATIAFGLALPHAGRVSLADVRISYRENDHAHELRIGSPARLCVAISLRAC